MIMVKTVYISGPISGYNINDRNSTNTLSLGLHHIFVVVNSGPTAIPECSTNDNQTFMDFIVTQARQI